MSRSSLDLNADLGEGGPFDTELMPLISSANIACGGHVGDTASMQTAVALALRHGVALGAHPSHPDRPHFGRQSLARSPAEVHADVRVQVQALIDVAAAQGARLSHVKPHGALYNQAAADARLADAVAAAVHELDPTLRLVGLAGSELVAAAARHGLVATAEAFADRAYQPNGQLLPRSQPGAVLDDVPAVVAQVRQLVLRGGVQPVGGPWLAVQADSLCVHGDGAHALTLLQAVRQALAEWGVAVRR